MYYRRVFRDERFAVDIYTPEYLRYHRGLLQDSNWREKYELVCHVSGWLVPPPAVPNGAHGIAWPSWQNGWMPFWIQWQTGDTVL